MCVYVRAAVLSLVSYSSYIYIYDGLHIYIRPEWNTFILYRMVWRVQVGILEEIIFEFEICHSFV